MKHLEYEQNTDKNLAFSSESTSDSAENASSTETKNSSVDEKAKSNTQEEFQDRVKKREQQARNHIWYVRKCLDEAFTLSDLQIFCQAHFYSTHKRLKHQDDFDLIIIEIINYCRKNLEFESLWEKIGEERPLLHKRYYSDWKLAFKENEYEVIAEHETVQSAQNNGDQPHPLMTEDSTAISEWFFKALTQQEQSLMLTVALFEGMNRRQMVLIAQDINKMFFDEINQ